MSWTLFLILFVVYCLGYLMGRISAIRKYRNHLIQDNLYYHVENCHEPTRLR